MAIAASSVPSKGMTANMPKVWSLEETKKNGDRVHHGNADVGYRLMKLEGAAVLGIPTSRVVLNR